MVEWVGDLPVIPLIPSKEICSFGECVAPTGHAMLQLLSWKCLLCSFVEGFSKMTLLKTYIRWLNLVIYGQNMSTISFVPFNDLLKLVKTPSRLRIGFGENNYCYPTQIENMFFDVHPLYCIFLVKESGETKSWEGIIEMWNKFITNFFSIKVDENIIHPWEFGSRRDDFHGRN